VHGQFRGSTRDYGRLANRRIKAPTVEVARDRVLSDIELAACWRASGGLEWPYSGFMHLLILTGQRRNEVAAMTWKELDLDARVWTLPGARAKNGIEHTIPLPDSAVDILTDCPRIVVAILCSR